MALRINGIHETFSIVYTVFDFISASGAYYYDRLLTAGTDIPVHVSKLRLLILREAHIHRRPITLLVGRPASNAIYNTRDNTDRRESKTDRVPGLVIWGLCRDEGECGNDATQIAETDLPSTADAAAVVTTCKR